MLSCTVNYNNYICVHVLRGEEHAHHQKQAYKLISLKHRIDTIHTGWKKMIVAQTSKFINGFMPALTLK